MMNVFLFGILGLGIGAGYTLLAQGLVVIYRGSGVINFAQGAYATVGAYLFVELRQNHGNSFAVSFVVAVLGVAVLGALTHLLIMRPLRAASSLTRVIATLGVLSIVTGIGALRYGANLTLVRPFLPQHVVHILGAKVSVDRLWMLLIATVLTAVLYLVSRYTTVGLAMTATSENQRAASSLGWSPDLFATVTWAVGGALAATAGILIVPLSGLQVTNLTVLVIAAMAAALFGDFTSYPRTWLAAVIIGIGVSEMNRYVTQPGWPTALPFLVIILVLVVRGRALPLRSQVLDRLPRLGSGVPKVKVIVVVSVFLVVGMLSFFPQGLTIAIGVQVIAGVLLLSVVVLTGYAGQLSLGQFALAGMGAYVAGRLVGSQHVPFALALLIGVLVAVPIGMIFALPALRTRGVNLAVVTLGLGVSIQAVIFGNPDFTGGIAGTNVGAASFLGIDIDPINHPDRYAVFCLVWFVAACLVIANVRRSRVGRRLVAIRGNERAAASLGISALGSKMFAFGLSSAVAGLLAFQSYSIVYSNFDPVTSINLVGDSVIGGVGYVTGTIPGSGFFPGGIGSYILDDFGSLQKWLILIGGISLVVTVLLNPDGIVGQFAAGKVDPLTAAIIRKVRARRQAIERARAARALSAPAPDSAAAMADPTGRQASLEVHDITVRFGGVLALSDVSLHVGAGEVLGLIGPNGAGKTTMVDTISGFTRQSSGSVTLNGKPLDRSAAFRRARAGISRSWQSLELFEDLTVLENLQAASDPRDRLAYVSNLVRTDNRALPAAAAAAVEEFNLTRHLNDYPNVLSYGTRRLVGIARTVAAAPSILLLDEPAAGLDESETRELSMMIRRLADVWGLGILLVEHDMNMVMSVCDRLVVLDFGKVIAEGPPAVLRHDPAVIASYLGEPIEDDTASAPENTPVGSSITTDP
jgi:ABC-type branched-subunit amino acid transport system ATPase component/ABC-type branched-subunit amino acid transport system permease subunit